MATTYPHKSIKCRGLATPTPKELTMSDTLEEKNNLEEEKLDIKRVFPIFMIVLIDILGLTIIIPLLPLYATSFGASPFIVGVLAAAYPLMQFIGAPILGRLSDRYGRKPILIISQIGTLVGFIMLGFANSLLIILLSRVIDGISGANIATAQAAISDVTTKKTRTQGLGLIGAAFGLGFIIGPVIAFISLALTDNNYQVPAFAAAICSLLSILLTVFWLKETLPEEKRRSGTDEKQPSMNPKTMIVALRHPTIGLLLLLMFGQQLAFGGFELLLALFTLNRLGLNASGNALVLVYVGVIVVAVQGGLIGKWSRRYGDRRLVYAGLALLAIGLLSLGLTPKQPVPWYSETELTQELSIDESGTTNNDTVELPDENNRSWVGLAWVLVAMIPVSIGGGILQPAINSLITKRVDPLEIGGMLGISAAFYSLAMAIAPLFGGFFFQTAGATNLFILWSILLGILFFVALRFLKPGQEETQDIEVMPQGSAH